MKLTPFDRIRVKHEQEFQARIIAALEKLSGVDKQKHNRVLLALVGVWTALNSSFVVWLLTAGIVTAGGYAFTSYERCYREADQLQNQYYRLVREIYYRRKTFADTVANASNAATARKLLGARPYLYNDLRDQTLFQLIVELSQVTEHVRPSKTLTLKEEDASYHTGGRQYYLHNELLNADQSFTQEIPAQMSDRDFTNLKPGVAEFFHRLQDQYDVAISVVFSNRCSTALLDFASSGQGKILEADVRRPRPGRTAEELNFMLFPCATGINCFSKPSP